MQEVIWVQDESASVQVYVLNPCAVAIPQQAEQQLILSLSSAHCNITEGGVPEATDKASAATSKPYQVQVPNVQIILLCACTLLWMGVLHIDGARVFSVHSVRTVLCVLQVPAKLNITHRGLEKYAANACTSLKLRPKLPGREDLLVRRSPRMHTMVHLLATTCSVVSGTCRQLMWSGLGLYK